MFSDMHSFVILVTLVHVQSQNLKEGIAKELPKKNQERKKGRKKERVLHNNIWYVNETAKKLLRTYGMLHFAEVVLDESCNNGWSFYLSLRWVVEKHNALRGDE